MRLSYAQEITRGELESMGFSVSLSPLVIKRNGREIKPTRTKTGITYQFWFGRRHFTISAARLLWGWFYGSIQKNERVRFIDKDPENLDLSNLQLEEGIQWKKDSE